MPTSYNADTGYWWGEAPPTGNEQTTYEAWAKKNGLLGQINPITSPTTIPRPANEPVNLPMSGQVSGALVVDPYTTGYDTFDASGVATYHPPTTGSGYTYNPEDPGEIQWNYESPIIQEWQRTTQGPYTRQGLKSWMDKRGISVAPPTTSQPTVTQPTTPATPSEPAAVSGPVTPPTWLGNVPSSTAMKFSDPELSLRPLQAGGSQQLFPSFQMPSFNYPASNPRQGSKNWWEMDWG